MTTNSNATQVAPEVDIELRCLRQIVRTAHVPLTCMLLQDREYTHRKTLIGTAPFSAHLPMTEADDGNIQLPLETTHFDGIPRILREARASEVDQFGAETMFAIGSLAKPLLALTYCIIIEKAIPKFGGLTWDKSILQWMKELYGKSKPIFNVSESEIDVDPSVRDALLHYKALPHVNQFLFLADGTFQITDEDFLTYIEPVAYASNESNENRGRYEYSNANYILMALLLEKQAGCSIEEIMREHLLIPLGLTRTTMDIDEVTKTIRYPTKNYATGQRVSSDLRNLTGTPEQLYKGSTAYKITVGMWSCTNDIAKLFNAIFDGTKSTRGHITPSIVKTFLDYHRFNNKTPSQRAGVALAGHVLMLQAQEQGTESLNHVVRRLAEPDEESASTLHESVPDDEPDWYYKGGTSDGFTSTVYFHPNARMLAIVLSNASGPVDVTEPIARYSLRIAMKFRYRDSIDRFKRNIDKFKRVIDVSREDFEDRMEEQLTCAVSLWQRLEAEDRNLTPWSGNMQLFAGVYQHKVHKLEISITGNQAIFSRSRYGSKDVLTTMKIRASSIFENRLRLFPMQGLVFIDRLVDFKDLELAVSTNSVGRIMLISNAGTRTSNVVKDVYIKQ